jgi:hypothetical protein
MTIHVIGTGLLGGTAWDGEFTESIIDFFYNRIRSFIP